MTIAPTISSCLLDALHTKNPFVLRPPDAHCLYMRSILSIASSDYSAPIRDKLLEIGIIHMLRIDVMACTGAVDPKGMVNNMVQYLTSALNQDPEWVHKSYTVCCHLRFGSCRWWQQ